MQAAPQSTRFAELGNRDRACFARALALTSLLPGLDSASWWFSTANPGSFFRLFLVDCWAYVSAAHVPLARTRCGEAAVRGDESMKTRNVTYSAARQGLSVACVLLLLVFTTGVTLIAQNPAPPYPKNSQFQQPQSAQLLSPDQLMNLVAPVALYPDPLLSQVLAASTYPLEVVEAQQWLQRNGNLKGQQLTEAARQQNWDASIQAMVAFPEVLTMLNQDVQWTTALGNAFLAQQSDVMAAVQRMRARAQSNGRLSTTPQQTVTSETQGGQTAIDIAPADPQVIYVPQYDPAYVWGPPAWGYYPPLYYAGYGYGFYPGIKIGLSFGVWGGWGWGAWGWGWGPNWFGGS